MRIDVSDTGCGIPADQMDQVIFDPFVQVDRRLNRPIEGTGLGLAISRELAQGMRGHAHGAAASSASGRPSRCVLPRA